MALFESRDDHSIQPEENSMAYEDNVEYSPAYSQLANAQKPPFDPFKGT